MFTLKDISGAVVEKKDHNGSCGINYGSLFCDCGRRFIEFNKGVDKQSQVRLQFNREKLAITIQYGYFDEVCEKAWKHWPDDNKHEAYALADAIIAADKELIELVKDGE